MNRNQSKILGLYRINKNYLSSCDHKKYILKDDYIRFSHFHESSN